MMARAGGPRRCGRATTAWRIRSGIAACGHDELPGRAAAKSTLMSPSPSRRTVRTPRSSKSSNVSTKTKGVPPVSPCSHLAKGAIRESSLSSKEATNATEFHPTLLFRECTLWLRSFKYSVSCCGMVTVSTTRSVRRCQLARIRTPSLSPPTAQQLRTLSLSFRTAHLP